MRLISQRAFVCTAVGVAAVSVWAVGLVFESVGDADWDGASVETEPQPDGRLRIFARPWRPEWSRESEHTPDDPRDRDFFVEGGNDHGKTRARVASLRGFWFKNHG